MLFDAPQYKIKLLKISPNKRISLQKHLYRQEHWMVMEGKALVTIEDEIKEVQKDDYIFIPKNTVHRLENIGKYV